MTYDQRVAQIKGIKHERLQRHLDLKGKAHIVNPNFFQDMRDQGSITDISATSTNNNNNSTNS